MQELVVLRNLDAIEQAHWIQQYVLQFMYLI